MKFTKLRDNNSRILRFENKSPLVYLYDLYEHVLSFLVLLEILMASKKEGGGSTEASGQISLRNSKIFC